MTVQITPFLRTSPLFGKSVDMRDNDFLSNKIRFVTATTLFDGHDASINIFRRILQSSGAEVVHLGHNRTGLDIVETARRVLPIPS